MARTRGDKGTRHQARTKPRRRSTGKKEADTQVEKVDGQAEKVAGQAEKVDGKPRLAEWWEGDHRVDIGARESSPVQLPQNQDLDSRGGAGGVVMAE